MRAGRLGEIGASRTPVAHVQNYQRMLVWQRAHQFTIAIHRATERLPRGEYSALRSQLRRAALSVGANIAEGCGREGNRELANFLQIAFASATATEYHLLVVRDLDLIRGAPIAALLTEAQEIKRMLAGLIARVRAPNPSSNRTH